MLRNVSIYDRRPHYHKVLKAWNGSTSTGKTLTMRDDNLILPFKVFLG